MTITGDISQDRVYPMVGDVVTLRATGTPTGSRVRFRVTSVPPGSSIAIYDAQTPNDGWLATRVTDTGILEPDVHGEYVITAVEEAFAADIPHFDLDPTNAIEEWTETYTEDYSVYIGRRGTRKLGVGQDRVTFEAWAHASAPGTQGIITYWHDPDRAPRLYEATSELASAAMQSTNVRDVLAYFGGYGYTGTSDLITVNTNWATVPSSLLAAVVLAFNLHLDVTTNKVHDALDAANTMTGVAAPTTEGTLVTYANTFATKYNAHLALGAAAAHPNGADAVNVTTALTATDLESSITLLNNIRSKYNAHRVYTSSHYDPGDAVEDSRETWKPLATTATLAEAITYAVALAVKYSHHLTVQTVSATYHTAADTDNPMVVRTALDVPDLVAQVNEACDKLEAHAANLVWDTHAAPGTDYHAVVDHGCKVDERATDLPSAIHVLDLLAWAYLHHVDRDGNWHGGSEANAGCAFVALYGINLLHKYLLDVTLQGDTAIPDNMLTAVEDLVRYGGFSLG